MREWEKMYCRRIEEEDLPEWFNAYLIPKNFFEIELSSDVSIVQQAFLFMSRCGARAGYEANKQRVEQNMASNDPLLMGSQGWESCAREFRASNAIAVKNMEEGRAAQDAITALPAGKSVLPELLAAVLKLTHQG